MRNVCSTKLRAKFQEKLPTIVQCRRKVDGSSRRLAPIFAACAQSTEKKLQSEKGVHLKHYILVSKPKALFGFKGGERPENLATNKKTMQLGLT